MFDLYNHSSHLYFHYYLYICSFLVTVCKWMDCCLKCSEILAAKIPLRSRASGGGWLFVLSCCLCVSAQGGMRAPLAMARILRNYISMQLILNIFQFYCLKNVWRAFYAILKSEEGSRLCYSLIVLISFSNFHHFQSKPVFLYFKGTSYLPSLVSNIHS